MTTLMIEANTQVSIISADESPLGFSAKLAANQHQPRRLVSKDGITPQTKADCDLTPSSFLKGLFKKHCPHIELPIRPSKEDFVSPEETYDMEVSRAIRNSDMDKVQALFEAGMSLDASNQFGESLIHMACRRGNLSIVEFMIRQAKVQVDGRDDFGRSILHDACWTPSPNFDVMELLLKVVPPEYLMTEDKRGHTPFDYARKEHLGAWLNFLQSREDELVKRLKRGGC